MIQNTTTSLIHLPEAGDPESGKTRFFWWKKKDPQNQAQTLSNIHETQEKTHGQKDQETEEETLAQ